MGVINFTSVIFMILFSALLISGNNAQITDTDGDLLRNGGKYFIRPQGISVNGGLTITSPCPYYITRSKDETFPGIPVTISTPFKIPFIHPGFPVSIRFDVIIIDTCMQSLKWQVVTEESTGKSYVRTGGSDLSPDFSIWGSGAAGGSYKINYNNAAGEEVGFFEKDGLLGVNTGTPLSVVFIKSEGFNKGIAMKV
ncbi:unnamed protein product [Amaranthus hypochondriacus]